MATTECPTCRSRARIPDAMVGRSVKCPKCGAVFNGEAVADDQPAPIRSEPPRMEPPPRPDSPRLADAPPPTARRDDRDDRDDRPRPRREGSGGGLGVVLGFAGLGMGGLALILACVALIMAWRAPKQATDPLGPGLSQYDLTTPKSTLLSRWKMRADGNIRAQLELDDKQFGDELREQIKTLDVRKEAEYKGTTLLFVSYEIKGVKKYQVMGFEKNSKTGLWNNKYVSRFEVQNNNKELADQMAAWEQRGELK